jgi:EAL domain-containing protein (putative c-di-GMP-specific phosphodiesterase class I)
VASTKRNGEPAEFLRRADIALYRAKSEGRNCFRFFSPEMDIDLQRRAIIEDDLRRALSSGAGLDVHYQPQISAEGSVMGAEALLRWDHATLGGLHPAEVIPIAEEAGLIGQLGEFVFREACRAALRWPDLFVSVNVSPVQVARTPALPQRFKRIADEEGVSCCQLELEITENLFIEQGQNCEKLIETLRSRGFRIALDDFGTGYSSLSYLRRFRVDKIKLDKSFADDQSVEENVAIIRAAVSLAHALGLTVVAEGIETRQQEQIALEAGCDGLQGFRYAAAMRADQMDEYLNSADRVAA